MKSSLYALHLAPMKKLALIKGAEEAPISGTGGMLEGMGVVSMSTCCENLRAEISTETTLLTFLDASR